MLDSQVLALVLAAGKGTRMRSVKPKVLQPLGGKPMIMHLLDMLGALPIARIAIVYGYQGHLMQEALQPAYPQLEWVEQTEQLGTGHAVLQALPLLKNDGTTLILLGDGPLLQAQTVKTLLAQANETGAALLTAKLDNPLGYGRIIRGDEQTIQAIVEEKDCNPQQREIDEVNTGVMAVRNDLLREYLPQIQNNNAQQEYYLTDLIALLAQAGHRFCAVAVEDVDEVMGINDRKQLAQAEVVYRARQANRLLEAGVTLLDPSRIDIQGELVVGQDVLIEPNVMFKGKVSLGNRVVIETGCVLSDCEIGDDVCVHAHSIIEKATLDGQVNVGPFARIRPNTHLCANSRVGNFVEIKNATIGEGSKVNHLSYIGDAELGAAVNVGAGTITCNYDGANKWQTIVGDEVFIGSNSALVAPVTIEDGATIGAGSIITKKVEAHALAFTRAPVKTKANWSRPKKTKS